MTGRFVVIRRLGATFQLLGPEDWVTRLWDAQRFDSFKLAHDRVVELQHGQVLSEEEARAIVEDGASPVASLVTVGEIRHLTLTHAHSTTPDDSDRPALRGDATETGAPSGVVDLAVAGERGTAPPAGVVECPALTPEEGYRRLASARTPCDQGGGEGPQRPNTRAPRCTPAREPSPPVQLQLYPRCFVCGDPLPERSRASCSDRCRKERLRRQRFDRETKRQRAARTVTQ